MIVKKLINWISESGLKKKKVAEILKISPGHLSYILNGKRDPSITVEFRIKNLISG